jgi:hypothetical protein
MSYGKHTDFISGLTQRRGDGGGPGTLLAASGDGTLSVHDLRRGEAAARSEDDADDEMLSGGAGDGGFGLGAWFRTTFWG